MLHTCLASVRVTVDAGAWVQGHTRRGFIPSFLPSCRRIQLKCLLITSGDIPAPPFICFISHSQFHSSLGQFASEYCWRCIYLFSCPTTAFFTALLPTNKQAACQSCRPARPSLPPEVSFVENERLTGCFDTRALSLPLVISPNKRGARPHTWRGVSFHLEKTVEFLKKSFPDVALPVNTMFAV